MKVEDIIDYVVHTPHNPNKKVLRDMLETLIKENGGGQPPLDPDQEYEYDGGGVAGW